MTKTEKEGGSSRFYLFTLFSRDFVLFCFVLIFLFICFFMCFVFKNAIDFVSRHLRNELRKQNPMTQAGGQLEPCHLLTLG